MQLLVTDTLGRPVSHALVALLDSASVAVLSVSQTDAAGAASIVIPAEAMTVQLQIELLGYATLREVFRAAELREASAPLIFVLAERALELATAQVTGRRRPPPIVNNDSSRVDIDLMRDSTERSIIDLLVKAPGMRLRNDGSLEYRGRRVNRVKIDDKDLFGDEGYVRPLSELNVAIVQRVDAVANNHEDPVLARLEQSEETILNITTKDDVKGQLNGVANAATGATSRGSLRYDFKANALLITKSLGLYGDAQALRLNSVTSVGSLPQSASDAFRRPEPSDVRYGEAPPATSAWGGLPLSEGAPLALVGDARVYASRLTLTLRGQRGSRTRFQLQGEQGSDALARASVEEASGQEVNYRLTTTALQRIEGSRLGLDIEHTHAAPSGKTSWRLVGNATALDTRTDSDLRLLQNSQLDSFLHRNDAQDIPLHIGARLNQALGSGTAAQVYFLHDRGGLRDETHMEVDSAELDFSVLSLARPSKDLYQLRDLDYLRWRGGVRLFFRTALGVGQLFAQGESRRTETEQTLVQDFPQPPGTGGVKVLAQAYQLAEAGAKMSSALGRNYQLRSWVSAIGVRDGSDGASSPGVRRTGSGLGYAFTLSPTYGKLAWLTLYASRAIGLPYLPHQPGLAYVSDPFSVNLQSIALQATATERVGAAANRYFSDAGLRLRANLNYRYRIREVSGVYDLQSRSQVVNAAGQRRASGLATNLSADFTNLRLRTTGTLRMSYANTLARSNLVDVERDLRSQVFESEGLLNLPRLGRLISAVSGGYSVTKVSGGLAQLQEQSRLGLDLRYEVGHWGASAKTGFGFARVDGRRFQSYRYVEAELRYTLRQQDSRSPEFGLQCFGLIRPNELREVRYLQPFLQTISVEALPTTLVATLRVPFGTPRAQ